MGTLSAYFDAQQYQAFTLHSGQIGAALFKKHLYMVTMFTLHSGQIGTHPPHYCLSAEGYVHTPLRSDRD